MPHAARELGTRAASAVDASGPKLYPSRAFSMLIMLQPAGPKVGTPAAATPAQQTQTQQAATQQPSTPGAAPPPPSMGLFGSPIFLMILFVPFIFMMWRRNKKETEARSKLKKGDKVIAGGGLVGEVMDVDERMAKVKIAPGVTVQVLASALSPLEDPKPKVDSKDTKPKGDKVKSEAP